MKLKIKIDMKYIIRFFKLLLVCIIALFGFGFVATTLAAGVLSLYVVIPILYMKSGNLDESINKGGELVFERFFENVGFAPFRLCSKLIKNNYEL